jgi:hypothetical protein
MLEELARDDHVELGVVERELLLDVRPARRDAAAGRVRERVAVDVDPDHLVVGEIRERERAGAAAEIEDALAGPADIAPEERCALLTAVDEVRSGRLVPVNHPVVEDARGHRCLRRAFAVPPFRRLPQHAAATATIAAQLPRRSHHPTAPEIGFSAGPRRSNGDIPGRGNTVAIVRGPPLLKAA